MCNCVHKHNKTPHNTQAQGPGFYHLPPKHRSDGFLPEKAYSYHIQPPVLKQKPDKTELILKRLGNFFILSLPRCYFISLQHQLPDKTEKATPQRKHWMPKRTEERLDEITPEQEKYTVVVPYSSATQYQRFPKTALTHQLFHPAAQKSSYLTKTDQENLYYQTKHRKWLWSHTPSSKPFASPHPVSQAADLGICPMLLSDFSYLHWTLENFPF